MTEALLAIKDTPIPTILIAGGMLFIFLALAGRIEVPPERRRWVAIFSTLFMIVGIVLLLVPIQIPPEATTMPSSSTNIPTQNTLAAPVEAPTPTGIPTAAPTLNLIFNLFQEVERAAETAACSHLQKPEIPEGYPPWMKRLPVVSSDREVVTGFLRVLELDNDFISDSAVHVLYSAYIEDTSNEIGIYSFVFDDERAVVQILDLYDKERHMLDLSAAKASGTQFTVVWRDGSNYAPECFAKLKSLL